MAPIFEVLQYKNTYDWLNKKISFSLSSRSIDSLLQYIKGNHYIEFSINREGKELKINYNDDSEKYTLILKTETNTQSIDLIKSEFQGLIPLLERAKVRIYGW